MSISLNNIESRVTALEKRKGTNLTLLTSAPVFLYRSWKTICDTSSFNNIIVLYDMGAEGVIYDSNGFIMGNLSVIPLQAFDVWPIKNLTATSTSAASEFIMLKKVGSTIQGYSTQGGGNPNDNKVLIWGLNLYYKFKEVISYVNLLK